MSITAYAVPNDKFQVESNKSNPSGFAFPCSACEKRHTIQSELPCLSCGHNCGRLPSVKTAADILAGAMTFDQMSQLICDISSILGIDVISKPHSAEAFAVRVVGAVTVAKRRDAYVESLQTNHINLMRI